MGSIVERIGFLEPYELMLVVLGLGLLGVATLLRPLRTRPLSFPIVAMGLGAAAYLVAPGELPSPDPRLYPKAALHLSELGVVVSLMGVGLKLDRAPSWRTWEVPMRLLAIAMPLSIAAVALLGWGLLALSLPAAVLLGAVLAPTDPVLAADVQVGEPLGDEVGDEEEREDELRFSLTAEAGLNDALAFPFTYLAIAIAEHGIAPGGWALSWLGIDVVWRLVTGLVLGVAVGRLLARILLNRDLSTERDRSLTGIGALAATLLLYGATEALGGYGFLAVFVGAVAMRQHEREHELHRSLHVVAEQAEQVLLTVVLIAFGASVASGLLAASTPAAVGVAVAVLLVVRPLVARLSLLGSDRLNRIDSAIVSGFGIRGLGSFFYLAYALDAFAFEERDLLWAVTGLVVASSVLLHGAAASPVMGWRDRAKRSRASSHGAAGSR